MNYIKENFHLSHPNHEYLLSIVIPTFNSSQTIKSCLHSILQLSNKQHIQVVIIDSCSQDSTLELIRSFSVTDVNISICSEPDRGVSDAFNKGIKNSDADYILLLGSDDSIISTNIDFICESYLSAPMRGLFDILFTGIIDLDTEKNHFTCLDKITKKNSFIHPGTIISSDAYQKYGLYSLSFSVGMDYEFFSRAYKNQARYVNIYLPTVIHSSAGISSNKFKCLIESFRVRQKYFKANLPLFELINYTPSILRSSFNFFLRYLRHGSDQF
jgi:glycosyltransferase involved in cell wall biosynthesis